MRSSKIIPTAVVVCLGLFGLLSLSAWFHVQSVRLSYRTEAIRRELAQLDRHEQAECRAIEAALSLSRLDAVARSRRGMSLPRPDQIRLLIDI